MWSFPEKDEHVKAHFEKPIKLVDFIESSFDNEESYAAVFVPGDHGAIARIKTLLDQAYFTENFTAFEHLKATDFECNPALYLRKIVKPPANHLIIRIRKPRLVIRTPLFKITF